MHAYLIMAHHRPDLLRELLDALDDPRNDIFVHIDKSSDEMAELKSLGVKHAHLHHIRPMEVNWGGYSQVKCEMHLLRAAVKAGRHDYYHLLTGASYPLRSQDYLFDFFERYAGTEFIAFEHPWCRWRVSQFHLFNEIERKPDTPKYRWMREKRQQFIAWQEKKNLDFFKIYGMEFKKGLAYWSITHELAEYVVKHRRLVYNLMRHSMLGDEVFLHLLVWNSPFRDKVFRLAECSGGALVATTWPVEDYEVRPGHNFIMRDLDYLLNTEDLYALKFEGPEGLEVLERVKQMIADEAWPTQIPQPEQR